jgi:hypothetical protein
MQREENTLAAPSHAGAKSVRGKDLNNPLEQWGGLQVWGADKVRFFIAGFMVFAFCVALDATAARATGTVRVQQSSGSVQLYPNSRIEINNKDLRITTADKKGTLVIDDAACSFVGQVMRCLPYSMALNQGGGLHPLDFQRGTVYLNLTDVKQPLPLTSKQLPPHSIMLSLTTKIGTIVDVTGQIDKVTR